MKQLLHKLLLPILALATVLPALAAPIHENPPIIESLAKLVGGKWVGTIGEGEKAIIVEHVFRWHPDKKGIVGEGVIGKGTKDPVILHVTLGWDAKAGKAYYLDTHNTSTVYYGHISDDSGGFLYEFGVLGGDDPKAFRSRDRFVDENTRESEILDKNGNVLVKFQVKRVK